mgnify:CR=1 FL=1
MDGHFSLINTENEIIELPFETFQETDMIGIILKRELPSIVQRRLQQRDGIPWNVEKLKEFQLIEEERANEYALKNHIPLFLYKDDNQFEELLNFIDKRG